MHTSQTPDGWFTPVDEDFPGMIAVDPLTGAVQVHIPLTQGHRGVTSAIVQEVWPSGRPADRYESVVFACICPHEHITRIQLGLN